MKNKNFNNTSAIKYFSICHKIFYKLFELHIKCSYEKISMDLAERLWIWGLVVVELLYSSEPVTVAASHILYELVNRSAACQSSCSRLSYLTFLSSSLPASLTCLASMFLAPSLQACARQVDASAGVCLVARPCPPYEEAQTIILPDPVMWGRSHLQYGSPSPAHRVAEHIPKLRPARPAMQ